MEVHTYPAGDSTDNVGAKDLHGGGRGGWRKLFAGWPGWGGHIYTQVEEPGSLLSTKHHASLTGALDPCAGHKGGYFSSWTDGETEAQRIPALAGWHGSRTETLSVRALSLGSDLHVLCPEEPWGQSQRC